MKWLLDKLGGALIGQVVRIIFSLVLPISAPIIVAFAGIAQKVEWYLWILAAFASLWFCLSSINQYHRISSDISSKWKLSQVDLGINAIADHKNIPAYWTDIQVQVILHNKANFPIEYEFDHIDVRVNGNFNKSPIYFNKGSIVDPGVVTSFLLETVPVGQISPGDEISGNLSIVIKYGRPGAMRHRLLRKYQITGVADANRMPLALRWYSLPANEVQVVR